MPINSFLYPAPTNSNPYEVANSLRFDDGSSDYLNRTQSTSPTNSKIGTISFWVKRSTLGDQHIVNGYTDTNNRAFLNFTSDDRLQCGQKDSGSTVYQIELTARSRDVSAWSHVVFAFDTTDGTAGNRVKIYVNGTQDTTFTTNNAIEQNQDIKFFNLASLQLGRAGGGSNYFDGYLAEFVYVDGTQLDADQFGKFDSDTNIWIPKEIQIADFGTNGFYLDFEDSSALGNDVSGNDNDFTANNLTSVDQSTDTCTNNFATWNPLTNGSYQTLSDGNLKGTGNTSTNNGNTWSTIHFPSAGKWYWETKVSAHSSSANYPQVGIIRDNTIAQGDMNTGDGGYVNSSTDCYYPAGSTTVYSKDGNDTVSATSVNDILMCAMDSTAGAMKFWIGVNGTWFASGDPANGNNAQWTETGDYQPVAFLSNFNNSVSETNFGSPTFSISSGNSDANGYGNFEYSVPSGFYALNSKNLAEFG